jgi:hypothetical protein
VVFDADKVAVVNTRSRHRREKPMNTPILASSPTVSDSRLACLFSPDFPLNPKDFAEAWNAEPECRAIAKADLSEATHTLDPTATVFAVLTGIPIGIAANLITDWIKRVIAKKAPSMRQEKLSVEMQEPDGRRVVIVYEKTEVN